MDTQVIALITGRITFPEGALQAWRAMAIEPTRFDDWPEDPLLFGIEPPVQEVGALLDLGAAMEDDDHPSFVETLATDGAHVIRGVLSGEERVVGWHLGFVTAMRHAAELGAEGAITILHPGLGGGVKVTLTPKKNGLKTRAKTLGTSTVELAPSDELFADERVAAALVALHGWVEAKTNDPALRRGPFLEGEARYWLEEPTAAEARALELAQALDDAALESVLADADAVAPDLTALGPHVGGLAGLRDALTRGTPLARVIAVDVLARAGHAEAEALALELLAHRSRYVQRMTLRALGRASSAAAFDALLARVMRSQDGGAVSSLGAMPYPEASPRLAALLEASLAEGDRERAFSLLQAVVARRDPSLVPLLLRLFDDPACRFLVPSLAQGLAQLGGPEVEARAEEVQHAMFGMGRALNQDVARRAELLGIQGEKDLGGIIRFDDLDLPRFTALLEEEHIHPNARQNDAPSTIEFYDLMTRYPELRAQGYAVSPKRPDYRVHIDGVGADLSEMDEERAAELRSELEALADTASQAELDGDHVSLWWT